MINTRKLNKRYPNARFVAQELLAEPPKTSKSKSKQPTVAKIQAPRYTMSPEHRVLLRKMLKAIKLLQDRLDRRYCSEDVFKLKSVREQLRVHLNNNTVRRNHG